MAKKILLLFVILIPVITFAQKDAMLHTSKSDYPILYGVMPKEDVKAFVDRVFNYISSVTPAQMIDKQSGNAVNDVDKANRNTELERGDFSITSYEWGVTYSALLTASKIFGEQKYADYVKERFSFISKWAPVIKKLKQEGVYKNTSYPLRQPIDPHALDDAGAMCAAMIKAMRAGVDSDLKPQINTYINWIAKKAISFF